MMIDAKRITPVWIHGLTPNEVFVFGSNLKGVHGAGAAKQAVMWGAKPGIGFGLLGRTFAIPTKDREIKQLDLPTIEVYVEGFILVAREKTKLKFLVTEIGCGLAGYTPSDIAPMFRDCLSLENVYLPAKFLKIIS